MTDRAKKDSMEEARELFDTYSNCRSDGEDNHVCEDGHKTNCGEHWFDEEDFIKHLAEALSSAKQRGFEEGVDQAARRVYSCLEHQADGHWIYCKDLSEEINALKAPKK